MAGLELFMSDSTCQRSSLPGIKDIYNLVWHYVTVCESVCGYVNMCEKYLWKPVVIVDGPEPGSSTRAVNALNH